MKSDELRMDYPQNQPEEKFSLDTKQCSDAIGKGGFIIRLYKAGRIVSCQGELGNLNHVSVASRVSAKRGRWKTTIKSFKNTSVLLDAL